MSVITSVVFTLMGGLVAGGVGYFATMVGLREQRKQRHLEEHKTNLKAISEALDKVFGEVWMFVYGADDLKLPKSPFGNERRVSNIHIKDEPINIDLSDPFSNEGRKVQVGINAALYDDIPAHFPKLNKLLAETDIEVKENGISILRLLNSLSTKIYEELKSSEIDFPYWTGNKTELKKFSELSNEAIEWDYAGSIFLMVIGEDEGDWSSKVGWLKNNHIYNDLKKMADTVKQQFWDQLNQLLALHNRLFKLINESKNEIEKLHLITRLKGKCPYL